MSLQIDSVNEVDGKKVIIILNKVDIWNKEEIRTILDNIKDKFHKAGLRSKYKTPYQPPHILFWNLRKTSGFPVLSTQKNVSMLSGYSSTLLNIFCNKGVDGLKQFTPRKLLEDIIEADRFSYMDEPLEKFYNRS